jgi:hypothetical protein
VTALSTIWAEYDANLQMVRSNADETECAALVEQLDEELSQLGYLADVSAILPTDR